MTYGWFIYILHIVILWVVKSGYVKPVDLYSHNVTLLVAKKSRYVKLAELYFHNVTLWMTAVIAQSV
jgi:hypothetical protein